MKAWFVSDIHLKSVNERNGVILLRFLQSLAEDPKTTHLFLLGDIFEIWVGNSSYFVDQFAPLIEALEKLKRRGVHIVYFEGNHDFHLEDYWRNEFGAEVYTEPHYFPIDSIFIRCEHGDFINPEDKAYLRYRKFVRSAPIKRLADSLPGSWIDHLGNAASKKSKDARSGKDFQEKRLVQMVRDYAKKSYQKDDPFDVIITGHIHVRDEATIEVDGHRILSINLGTWLDKPCTYLLEGKKGKFIDL